MELGADLNTRRDLRESQWRGEIANRAGFDRRYENGATDATEKSRLRALEPLATREVVPLPDGVAERLDAVVPAEKAV